MNSATNDELRSLDEIGESLAKAIEDERAIQPFTSIDDLEQRIPRIKKLPEKAKQFLYV